MFRGTDGLGAAALTVLAQASTRPDQGGAGVVWAFVAMGLIVGAVAIVWRLLQDRSDATSAAESVHEARTEGLEAGLGLDRPPPDRTTEPVRD